MKKIAPIFVLLILLIQNPLAVLATFQDGQGSRYTKTPLLSDREIAAMAAELNGIIAKDTIIELARHHRVQASSGFSRSAEYIASKAKEYGLEQVQIERFPADGEAVYHTLKSTPGWEAERGKLVEVEPNRVGVADYDEMRVALADYSQTAEVTAELIDVGAGTSAQDYEGKEVEGRIVLAGGNVAAVHALACKERGAVGILSYQQNQVTGWSGDYVDNVRWGHLSPYEPENKFAFMISLRTAAKYRERLARGERIRLQAEVKAAMQPGYYDIVSAVIPGTDPGEEIVYTCHLCHQKPGANDNASGAAAILEVARTLATLIRRGEIRQPRRTIRFIWPPEINGTLVYFSEHPEIVSRMKAVVHCDMVGGNFEITKSILHVTRTPASLPSAINTVAEIIANYVIAGSVKAASGQGVEDGLISPQGSKSSLVADITPYEMGSDHDVYQEGSFRIPAIYLRDWPDVFIHTNNDTPANIDPTKMKRSSFIAAASGYFLARANAEEASRLADEIFARALARVPRLRDRARSLEASGPEGAEEGRNLIAKSLESDAMALSSVLALVPGDEGLESKVDNLINQLSGSWLFLTGQFIERRRGDRITFTFEPKEEPKNKKKEKKPRNPKEASRPRSVVGDYSRVPSRKVKGPMNVYYYDYLADRASEEDLSIVRRIGSRPGGGRILYEILNLVDGKRSARDIRDFITAAYEPIPVEEVAGYLQLLEKVGVIEFEE
ncbi:MAG: DUF4910 domain-containing protein [Blastocatellia bacterium]|nr:DUF4910 domain-containing protein [Blastocatellia bacterium]